MTRPEQVISSETLHLHQEILMDEQEIRGFVVSTAEYVMDNYHNPLFVCFRRGGEPFAASLMQTIVQMNPGYHPEMDSMTIRTYGDGREAGEAEIITGLAPVTLTRLKDRRVIALDDVLDTGETISTAERYFFANGASSVDLIAVCEKDKPRERWQHATLVGKIMEDIWLTGFGLDDPGLGPEANRWLPYIARAND